MTEGKDIMSITVTDAEQIVFASPVQHLDVICYSGTLYLNWHGDAVAAGADCLKMVEKSSYEIKSAKPFTTLNIAGSGEMAVVRK